MSQTFRWYKQLSPDTIRVESAHDVTQALPYYKRWKVGRGGNGLKHSKCVYPNRIPMALADVANDLLNYGL